jgi:hypothetical protein
MTEPKEPSLYQMIMCLLNTTENIEITSTTSIKEHNINVENDEPKASVQLQREEIA